LENVSIKPNSRIEAEKMIKRQEYTTDLCLRKENKNFAQIFWKKGGFF